MQILQRCCVILVAILRLNGGESRATFATILWFITREVSGENHLLKNKKHGKKHDAVVAERARIVEFRQSNDEWMKWEKYLTTDTEVGYQSSIGNTVYA